MEQAYLFKYLYQMSMDEISLLIDDDETIENAMYKLDMAARTRHIIRAVQMEDLWQAFNKESQTYDLYLCMRLSPMTLASCFNLNHDMNCLEWRFVFPRYDDIDMNSKPSCFGEYVNLNKNVQIVDIENYDIARACEFLDKAYDFTPHKLKQVVPPVNRRQQGGFSQ